jgi:hypothetical protein
MNKLLLLTAALGIAGALGFATITASSAQADDDKCHHKELKTVLVHDACLGKDGKGGSQTAAKDAMKAFMKAGKSKQSNLSCNTCHKKLAPDYPLTDNAYATFQKLGGEMRK